eukprot:CAMPEP_0197835924 /NCGR_PEP_ID=MMETSP1437-20131217/27396_1 /TAXON_ID=49252 ORGANISM="Eucampia antarctica, Strain CCMP1452" /NCGR_SAMPLE_ID=MMETSP1437 /ASSEMBLY_ACC=CAM_ASM_001096 /LENGTH=396 /DNA_ID=CAMNT_0043441707 /DNA_START=92 /DNA_END=1282 /DNA_ORIENTATION=+
MAHQASNTVTLEKEFVMKGKAMDELMSRALEDNNDGNTYSHLAGYTVKFQGCHQIQQWNEDADEDDEVKILTKRLVRFRMVPADQCANHDFRTVSAKYGDVVNQYLDDARSTVSKYTDIFDDFGDYVVDLNTFVAAYLEGKAEEEEGRCEIYESVCYNKCGAEGSNDDLYADENGAGDYKTSCYSECYADFGLTCGYSSNQLDPYDYAQCAQLDLETDDDANDEFYLGPYCAEQGGAIKMGVFSDNTCTTFSSCGASCYESKTGYSIPGSDGDGLINQSCMSCSVNYVNIEKANNGETEDGFSNFNFGYTRSVCSDIYAYAGKCEDHMKNSDDKTSTGCSYIEGVKILTSEGTVDSRSKSRSTSADLSMGILVIGCVFFGMYIFYLKDKLSSTRFA